MVTPRSFVIAAVLLMAAFGAAAQSEAPGAAARPQAAPPVAVTLRTDKKVYAKKDPIKLIFTVKNASKSLVNLNIASGMRYEFEIHKGKSPAGERVWQWSRGRMFTQMIQQITMQP